MYVNVNNAKKKDLAMARDKSANAPQWRLSLDSWAVISAALLALLIVSGVLPAIPW